MIDPRILVGFAEEGHNDRLFAQQLVDDLRHAGHDVALLESNKDAPENEQFIQTLNQQLSVCEQVLVVLTPEALYSTKVQMLVNTALNLVVQQRLRSIFAILASPIDSQEMPATWTTIRMFDATQDYPRALARLQLALNPITSATIQHAPPPSFPTSPQRTVQNEAPLVDGAPVRLAKQPRLRQRTLKQWFFVPLTVVVILGLLLGLITYVAYALPQRGISNATHKTPSYVSKVTTPQAPTTIPTPLPTAIPTTFPKAPRGLYAQVQHSTPLINDPLNQADANNWSTDATDAGGCTFRNGAYDIASVQTGHRQPCVLQNNPFQNFALQGQMSFVTGPGPCGLIARKQASTVMSYRLNYYANGDYEFLGPAVAQGKTTTLIKMTHGPTTTQPVTLTMIAQGATFYIYVNGQFVASATDATFASGTIGFFCRDYLTPTEARFTNAKIWNR